MIIEENLINVSADEKKRQAIDSLRGYKYQVYRSLVAWLDLQDNETLLLEVAEDYAIVAKDTATLVGVKDTKASGNITFKTPSVAAIIKSLWSFQENNQGKNVTAVYLTTANIGKERDLEFPQKIPGLIYWRIAARDGADVEPIRTALFGLGFPKGLNNFIKTCSPKELRERILRPIKWICGEQDIFELDKTICDSLVNLGATRGIDSIDAEKAKDSLLAKIWDVIILPAASERKLNKAEFYRIFDKAALTQVSKHALSQLITLAAGSIGNAEGGELKTAAAHVIKVDNLPALLQSTPRKSIVDNVFANLSNYGAVWLYGSSGLGKTTLAILTAKQSTDSWLIVDLRDCEAQELSLRLLSANIEFHKGRYRGVIFDDFPSDNLVKPPIQLSIIIQNVRARDGLVIFTSYKKPAASFENTLGNHGFTTIESPYFTEDDVAELVANAGGDPKTWARVIHTFCGFGHPQLVIARIKGLQIRSWPKTEITDGMLPAWNSPKEVEEQRDAVKKQLMSNLSEDARHLLYALSLVMDSFEREFALTVGESIGIATPGDAFDFLVGPWIEALGNKKFRLSPLVNDTGSKNLGIAEQKKVRNGIINYLLSLRPFPAEHLFQLVMHSLVVSHEQALYWSAMAIIHYRFSHENNFNRMASEISLFSVFKSDGWLFEGNKFVSILLRYAQFLVALENKDFDKLGTIYNRLNYEVKSQDEPMLIATIFLGATASILQEKTFTMSPNQWMPLIIELENYQKGDDKIAAHLKQMNEKASSPEFGTISQGLFVIRTTHLNSIDELLELLTILDKLPTQQREYFLTGHINLVDIRLMVNAAWLAESKLKGFEATVASEKLKKCREIAENWGNEDLAIECGCAQAVMLDEYGDNPQEALQILTDLEVSYPHNFRIGRQRQKVFFRKGEHAVSLSMIEEIAEKIPLEDKIERAFAFREAGCSAAEIDKKEKALAFFAKAREASSQCSDSMLPMSIGLLGDMAMISFEMEEYKKALQLLMEACLELDKLSEVGIREKWCHIIIGHLILWMRSQINPRSWVHTKIPMIAGACSKPEPPEEIISRKLPPSILKWYQLAELELELNQEIGVVAELQKRTKAGVLLFCECSLHSTLLTKFLRNRDAAEFVRVLPMYASSMGYMYNNKNVMKSDTPDLYLMGKLPDISKDDWKNEPFFSIIQNASLAFITACICSGKREVLRDFTTALYQIPDIQKTLPLYLSNFLGDEKNEGEDAIARTVLSLKELLKSDVPADLRIVLWVTCNLWNWLARSDFKNALGPLVATCINVMWTKFAEEYAHLLQYPPHTITKLQDVLSKPSDDIVRLAEIAVIAEDAAVDPMPDWLRDAMKKAIG